MKCTSGAVYQVQDSRARRSYILHCTTLGSTLLATGYKLRCTSVTNHLHVFAIDFAIEFVPFAIEFVPFAIEFVPFASSLLQ